MDSLNVHAYSLYKLLQLTYVCDTLKTIISDTSEVNVTKRLPVRNIFGFVIAQRCVFLLSFLRLGVYRSGT